MNDETKAELMQRSREWLQSCVNAATRSGVPEEADLEAFILAHLDGEAARTAAAVAAAREEQREACALWMQGPDPTMMDVANGETVRGTPLTATPLADRIAELERVLAKSLANRIVEKAKQADQPCGHPAAVANRSAETGVAFCDLCRLNEMLNDALAMEAKHKAERDALRDQVEEARAGLTEIACFHEGPEVHGGFDEPGSAQTARDTLAAMDEAKP